MSVPQFCRMLILLSPAKTLKPTNPSAEQHGDALTTPVFLDHAKAVCQGDVCMGFKRHDDQPKTQ